MLDLLGVGVCVFSLFLRHSAFMPGGVPVRRLRASVGNLDALVFFDPSLLIEVTHIED